MFVNKETQELHPRTAELFEEVAQRIEESGIDAWFELEPEELLGAEIDKYEKVTDTMDVWFDSGVTHFSVMEKRDELQYPADLYLRASGQRYKPRTGTPHQPQRRAVPSVGGARRPFVPPLSPGLSGGSLRLSDQWRHQTWSIRAWWRA